MSLTTFVNTLRLVNALAGQPDTTKVEEPEKIGFAKSNIELHQPKKQEDSKARLNLFYKLPAKTDVYTFIEFYPEGNYFARTGAHTPVNNKGTGIRTEMKNSNMFDDQIGLGLEQRASIAGVNTSVKVIPIWADNKGYIKDNTTVCAYAGKNWNIKDNFSISISAFGEVNVAAENGPNWCYGEANAEVQIPTKIGKLSLGVGYNFNGNGSINPNKIYRMKIGFAPIK